MNKIFHLSTCKTCQRILSELEPLDEFELREIKSEPITEAELDRMKELAGSYEALFSRRARKYRAMGLHEQELDEPDYRRLILDEYTFLNRPVILLGKEVFVGSSKKNVAAVREKLGR
jgi:arsenate reductase-like glutaredoxin family protein